MKVGPKSSLRPFLHRALQLCGKLCGSQILISNVLGGAKWCFDWYFSLFK